MKLHRIIPFAMLLLLAFLAHAAVTETNPANGTFSGTNTFNGPVNISGSFTIGTGTGAPAVSGSNGRLYIGGVSVATSAITGTTTSNGQTYALTLTGLTVTGTPTVSGSSTNSGSAAVSGSSTNSGSAALSGSATSSGTSVTSGSAAQAGTSGTLSGTIPSSKVNGLATSATTDTTQLLNIGSNSQLFIIPTFRSGENRLRLLISTTGTDWQSVGSTIPTDYPGQLRDPSTFIYNSGTYTFFHTIVSGTGAFTGPPAFAIQSGTDFTRFSLTGTVPVAPVSGTFTNVWSPVPVYDASGTMHIFFSASIDSGTTMLLYETHPLVSGSYAGGGSAWSSAVQLTGTFPNPSIAQQLFYNSGTYYLQFKNDVNKYIEYYTSTSLTGSYSAYKTGDWAGWGSGVEGGGAFNIPAGSGTWMQFMDKYTNQGIYVSTSTNGQFGTYSAKTLVNAPFAVSNPGFYYTTNAQQIISALKAALSMQRPAGTVVDIGFNSIPALQPLNSTYSTMLFDQQVSLQSNSTSAGYAGSFTIGANSYQARDGSFYAFDNSKAAGQLFYSAEQNQFALFRWAAGMTGLTTPLNFNTSTGNLTITGTLTTKAVVLSTGTSSAPSNTGTVAAWETHVNSSGTYKIPLYQ